MASTEMYVGIQNSTLLRSVAFMKMSVSCNGLSYHSASPHYKVIDEGCHYSDLIDFDSLLVNFLVCEVSMNWDSMKNSVYLYKDIEGPFYIGPAWDYDWAWGMEVNKVQSFNTVQVRAMDEAGNYLINPNGTVEGEYQNAISNYLYLLL